MQNYTNTKRPNSRKLQKEKHTQVAVTGGTALGGIKPNIQIIRKLDLRTTVLISGRQRKL